MLLADDLNKLLDILPQFISTPLQKHSNRETLIEIVSEPEINSSEEASSLTHQRNNTVRKL